MRHERDALDQKVTSLQRQIELLENSKRRTEQHSAKLSEQLNELSEKLVTRSAEFNSSPGQLDRHQVSTVTRHQVNSSPGQQSSTHHP